MPPHQLVELVWIDQPDSGPSGADVHHLRGWPGRQREPGRRIDQQERPALRLCGRRGRLRREFPESHKRSGRHGHLHRMGRRFLWRAIPGHLMDRQCRRQVQPDGGFFVQCVVSVLFAELHAELSRRFGVGWVAVLHRGIHQLGRRKFQLHRDQPRAEPGQFAQRRLGSDLEPSGAGQLPVLGREGRRREFQPLRRVRTLYADGHAGRTGRVL